MISKPLFRNGDSVHRRDDLRVERFYHMAHHRRPLILTNERFSAMEWAASTSFTESFSPRIVDRGEFRQMYYEVDGWYICDDMLVEGHRIMQFMRYLM